MKNVILLGAHRSRPINSDYRRILITYNLFREIKDPKHPLHTYYPLLKCPIVKWFFVLHTRISFHLAKLLAMDVILYHTAFQRSFRDGCL